MYLSIENLEIGYKKPITKPISFELNEGEILHIKGQNGSGKSTLLKTILRETPRINGEFRWNILKKEISYLPQSRINSDNFNFTLSEILNVYDVHIEIRKYLRDELKDKLWINASGGERQLVLILTRITNFTKVLILDEPLNHLDKKCKQTIEDLLKEIIKNNKNISIMIVSHQEVNIKHKELFI